MRTSNGVCSVALDRDDATVHESPLTQRARVFPPASPQSREPLALSDLKAELSPRISAEDLIDLCELSLAGGGKRTRAGRPKIVAVDIRSSEEYPYRYASVLFFSHFHPNTCRIYCFLVCFLTRLTF